MEYYTLQLILGGAMDVVTDLGRRRAEPGQACVVSPGERLRLRFAPETVQVAAKLPRDMVEQAYSVADITLTCGFLHLGRFARDYRLRYGITPSTTLHASRTTDRPARSG